MVLAYLLEAADDLGVVALLFEAKVHDNMYIGPAVAASEHTKY
jgi:hypothetical protein